MLGAGFAFFGGTIFGENSVRIKKVNKNCLFYINNNRLFKWLIALNLLAFIGFIAFLIKLSNNFSLLYLLQHLNVANLEIESLHEGLTGYLKLLAVPALILCEIAFLESRRKVLIWFFLIDFLTLVGTTRRSIAFFAILSMMLITYYWSWATEGISLKMTRQKFKLFMPWGISIFGILTYFSYIQTSLKKSLLYDSQYFTVRLPAWVNDIFTYATAGIAAIPAFLKMNFRSNVPLGYSLRPIYVMLNNFFPFAIPIPYFVREFVKVPVTTNVVPYFMYWYFDFGFVYMFIIIFLIAFLSERIFVKFLNTSNPFLLVVSSFFGTGFILSIRQNIFLTIYFWYFLAIIYIAFKTIFYQDRIEVL